MWLGLSASPLSFLGDCSKGLQDGLYDDASGALLFLGDCSKDVGDGSFDGARGAKNHPPPDDAPGRHGRRHSSSSVHHSNPSATKEEERQTTQLEKKLTTYISDRSDYWLRHLSSRTSAGSRPHRSADTARKEKNPSAAPSSNLCNPSTQQPSHPAVEYSLSFYQEDIRQQCRAEDATSSKAGEHHGQLYHSHESDQQHLGLMLLEVMDHHWPFCG